MLILIKLLLLNIPLEKLLWDILENGWFFFLENSDHPFLKLLIEGDIIDDMNCGLFHIPIKALKNQSGPFKIYPGNARNWARITAKEFDILPNTHELQECIEDSYRLRLNELGIYTNKKTNPVSFSAKDSDQISDQSEEAEEEEKPANKPSVPPSNRIYYGPPGTGKTYQLSQMLKRDYEQPAGSVRRYSFVTFHQSYGYEEFVEGLRRLDDDAEAGEIQYEIRPGAFKESVSQGAPCTGSALRNGDRRNQSGQHQQDLR